jgi:predicted TIM-barrel fold metal-dependent hydrolase
MIVDSHMHIEQDMYPLEKMLAGMDRNGIDKTVLIATMVEPFYLDSWLKKKAGDLMKATLLQMNNLGHVLYQSTVSKKGYFVLLGKKYRIFDKPDNAPVAEAIEKYPDRFLGWIYINPAAEDDPVSVLEKWGQNPGMVGVKAHPFWNNYPVEKLDPVAAWCRDNGYPLLIHLGCRANGDYRRLPEKYPGLKVIYAHAGIPFYSKMWSFVKENKDVYVDLSSIPYMTKRIMGAAIDSLGAEKCLYGSDGPYGGQAEGEDYDYGWIKDRLEELPLSDSQFEMIFSENFERIRKR